MDWNGYGRGCGLIRGAVLGLPGGGGGTEENQEK